MKKILLDSQKPFYKANLHSHSTISDGVKTPEELKKMYMEQGYSILAYTDHNILIDHSDLNEEKFLALNGYELDIPEDGSGNDDKKTCHLCLIALEPENLVQVCYHRKAYLWGNASKYKNEIRFDENEPDFVREYSAAGINKIIQTGREHGFFVTYNHPTWSQETHREYMAYHGMNAMEICNYSCVYAGFPDYNEKEYDNILSGGEKIYCIAADDNHNYRNDSFGGFTVINADRLDYRTVTQAMETGRFYASEGPEIFDLWYEDGKIGITCSDVVTIRLNTGIRRTSCIRASNGEYVKTAIFNVTDEDRYVRITIVDASGKHANTNAFFVEDLKKEVSE